MSTRDDGFSTLCPYLTLGGKLMPEGIPQYFANRQIPVFHPIHRREDGVWYPGNEAASLLIHISHVWEDILMLREMMDKSTNRTEKRLLFKYVLIELNSILQPIEKLQAIIMTAPISEQEIETAKRLFKAHDVAKKKVRSLLRDIRNEIGAHRGLQLWERVIQLWDSIEPQRFNDLLASIPPLFNFAKELDLYDWVRKADSGALEIFASMSGPWEPVDLESERDATYRTV
jgi:hypothetical protein